MGGRNSGRWYRWDKKGIVENCIRLDINRLVRDGVIALYQYGSRHWVNNDKETASVGYNVEPHGDDLVFRLKYSIPGEREKHKIDLPVRLEKTPVHFGGERWWFACPGCGRRCGKLYLPPQAKYFLCRICHNLNYWCQRADPSLWYLEQSQKIRERLGGSLCTGDPFPARPKGMHKKTYKKMCMKSNRAAIKSYNIAMAHLNLPPVRSVRGLF